MKSFKFQPRAAGWRSGAAAAIALFSLALVAGLALGGSAGAAPAAVPLATAGSFAILAGAGITNTGPTTVTGDVGTFPTTTFTGAASVTVNGTNHAGDGVAQQAKTDLVTAYDSAAGQGPTSPIAADLGGRTLTPGVYNSASSIDLTGVLTLNAAGDPNAVFVFQAGSSLTTASGSQVNLINGAQSCNVFWQVTSSATLGTGSSFRGTLIALTSITLTTGATVDGRVLARNGAVTLDTNTIARSTCAAPAATTTATTTATPTTTTTATPKPTPPTKRAAAVKKAKRVAAAKQAKRVAAIKTAKHVAAIKKTLATPKPRPVVHTAAFTG